MALDLVGCALNVGEVVMAHLNIHRSNAQNATVMVHLLAPNAKQLGSVWIVREQSQSNVKTAMATATNEAAALSE